MRKSDAIMFGFIVFLGVGGMVLGLWSMERARANNKAAFEAQCQRDGGKIVASYGANYNMDHVICVPVGVNPADVLRVEK